MLALLGTLTAVVKRVSDLNISTLRRLAVDASCDPRTVRAVAAGRAVKGLAGERARAALLAAGYTLPVSGGKS